MKIKTYIALIILTGLYNGLVQARDYTTGGQDEAPACVELGVRMEPHELVISGLAGEKESYNVGTDDYYEIENRMYNLKNKMLRFTDLKDTQALLKDKSGNRVSYVMIPSSEIKDLVQGLEPL